MYIAIATTIESYRDQRPPIAGQTKYSISVADEQSDGKLSLSPTIANRMTTCFVIQPFDSGKFDKRFDSIFKPAANQAGMEAYRVDRDNSATVLIQAIEENIRRSSVCLADITTDNPNVWFELGYAMAINRPVVMVCGEERFARDGKFPFDIQHRSILAYKTDSPQDFEEFSKKLVDRLRAMLEKSVVIDHIADNEALADIEGLSPAELTVLAMVASNVTDESSPTPLWGVRADAEKAGLTAIGFNLGLRRLKMKGFVSACQVDDGSYDGYEGLKLEARAWEWIEKNESKFVIHASSNKSKSSFSDMDDEIPF